tara:strand:- start:510 stop:683 length:174 start_codon:yes stop_codon:yes gene_type:complete
MVMVKPTTATVNQKIDDHVDACSDRYLAIDRRLYRIEAIMIGASASTIGLLLKIAFI